MNAKDIARPMLQVADYLVQSVSLDTCQAMVRSHHRQGGGSNTGTFCHGLFHRERAIFEADCLAIAWWIPPTKGAALASWSGDWRRVLALSRLVCVPDAPYNSCSFLLARSVEMIRASGDWDCLITYASERLGHTGSIYRATNWECLGRTEPEVVWVRDGQEVARKAGPHTRTRAEMEALGCQLLGRFAKIKYRMVIA